LVPSIVQTSANANSPIAMATKLTPSARRLSPNVKRSAPLVTSVPIVPMRIPSAAMPSVLASASFERTETPTSARTTVTVYSGAWKASAMRARGGERKAMIRMHAHPANSDDRAAMAKAGPARPCWAIG
jgi:hypothetical protein